MNGAAKVYSIDIGETSDEFQALSKRFPGQLYAVSANVTQEETISAAVEKIIEDAGVLHGMVVNAGRTNHKAALDFTKEEIETLFNVNVREFPFFPFCLVPKYSLLRMRRNDRYYRGKAPKIRNKFS